MSFGLPLSSYGMMIATYIVNDERRMGIPCRMDEISVP